MAIFSAGCIQAEGSKKAIREKVYRLVRAELDSAAMKISLHGNKDVINFIAFLPKEKIMYQNVLQTVAATAGRIVVIFELDYKHVGVVCEEGRIIDYILDKPENFALERGFATKFVDNSGGQKLQSINLQRQKMEIFLGSVTLLFSLVLVSGVLYGGYEYLKQSNIKSKQQLSLQRQYEAMVKKEFSRSVKMIERIDSVKWLNDVEKLTKRTKSTLKQIVYNDNRFCVQIKPADRVEFLEYLPQKTNLIETKGQEKDLIQYCYEKI